MQANRINGRDSDGSRNDVFNFLQPGLEKFIGLNDLFAVFVNQRAFRGESKFFLGSLNEQTIEPTLQGADLLTHSTLGNAIDLGGLGEAFRLRQVAKNFETFNLH